MFVCAVITHGRLLNVQEKQRQMATFVSLSYASRTQMELLSHVIIIINAHFPHVPPVLDISAFNKQFCFYNVYSIHPLKIEVSKLALKPTPNSCKENFSRPNEF